MTAVFLDCVVFTGGAAAHLSAKPLVASYDPHGQIWGDAILLRRHHTAQLSLDYNHRCKRYFLPLSVRRNISDVCYLFKIVSGQIDSPDLLSKIYFRTNLLDLRERSLLHIPFARTTEKNHIS